MLKKLAGVILLLGLGYAIGQYLRFPSDLLATDKSLESNINDVDKKPGSQQIDEDANTTQSAEEAKEETPPLNSTDILISANEEVEYGLWLGLYDDAGVNRFMTTLPKEYSDIAKFPFVNALNEEKTLLVLGPFSMLQKAQVIQNKLTVEYSINASVIKYPQADQ